MHCAPGQPNGQVSAAAGSIESERQRADPLRLSVANIVRLWAGHVPTTWRRVWCRPETEAATNPSGEQGRRFAFRSAKAV